jgi:hypothetical protein
VADPDIIRDLSTTKNSIVDKDENIQQLFSKLMGNTFLFSPSNDDWKRKRKACTHAFYKDKLERMMDTLKGKLTDYTQKWQSEIDSAASKTTTIDIRTEPRNIFSRNIMQITLGQDLFSSKYPLKRFIYEKDGLKVIDKEQNLTDGLPHTIEAILFLVLENVSSLPSFFYMLSGLGNTFKTEKIKALD